ncbi:MAG: Peptidyl-prolyl cis-trans isomerase (rotamase c)protein [Pseudomonadota bacterium]
MIVAVALAWVASVAPVRAAEGDAASGVIVERVAAVVNDDVILRSEVFELGGAYLAEVAARRGDVAAARAEVLERLVERTLMRQAVRRLNLDVTDADVERTIEDIAARNQLTRVQLRAEVERGGMTWEAYRAELTENLREMKFAQMVLRPRIAVREDEVQDAYRRATKDAPVRTHVQALFLAWPPGADEAARAAVVARAEGLRTEAQGGADFVTLARTHDQGPFGAQGGEMGTFGPGELVPALEAAVQATSTGAVSTPVASERGVFLLRVAGRTAGGADLEAMRPKLVEALTASRMDEERERWFLQARREASVRVLADDAAGPVAP